MYDLGKMPSDYLNRNNFEAFNITFVTNRPDGLIWFTGNDRENLYLTMKVTLLLSLGVNTYVRCWPDTGRYFVRRNLLQTVGVPDFTQIYGSRWI